MWTLRLESTVESSCDRSSKTFPIESGLSHLLLLGGWGEVAVVAGQCCWCVCACVFGVGVAPDLPSCASFRRWPLLVYHLERSAMHFWSEPGDRCNPSLFYSSRYGACFRLYLKSGRSASNCTLLKRCDSYYKAVGGYFSVPPHGPNSRELEHGSRSGGPLTQLGSCAPLALFC